jgi:transposase InsO family protein
MRRSGNPDRVPVTLVHKELLAKQELTGVKAPGFAQVRAALHRVPYQMRLTWAGGPEYLKKHGGLPRLSVPQPEAPNLEWYLDQWVADVFVLYEDDETGRPVVVTVIDRFGGGFALGLAIHRRFTAFTVAEAIMDGIHRNGKPKVIRLDLGRENRAKYIRSGCEALGTELAHTTPRDPSVKGLMEGLHNIYRQFSARLPWHAPSDILTKPLREEPMLPFADFCERFTAFVFGEYNTQPYTGQYGQLDQSRLELRQAAKFTPIIPAEDELRILFAKAKQATVGSQGIRLDGVTYSEERPGRKLATMIGQKVWARRGRTDVEIIVHDEQMHFVCIARNALAEAAGMDDEVRRQYTADRRTLAKAMATQADERIARARSKPDWLLQRAQQRLREQDQTPPRPAVRQITAVTGQTPAIAQAGSGGRYKIFRHQR